MEGCRTARSIACGRWTDQARAPSIDPDRGANYLKSMDESTDRSEPLEGAELEHILRRLADPATTRETAERLMAGLEGQEARIALPLFARLRDGQDPAELRAVSRLMARWAGRPVTRAIVPALQAMLAEEGVADLNRMTAAGLLETLGEPVDYPEMLGKMGDLDALARQALRSELEAATGPAEQAAALEQLDRMPVERVLAFIDDLARIEDGRAAPLLAALTHAGQPDVAVSAVAAIDRLGLARARPALQRVAEAHPDLSVRQQARLTLDRLPRAKEAEALAERLEAFASRAGAAGARLLLLMRARADGRHDSLTLVLDAELGLRDRAAREALDERERAALLDHFAAGGRPLEALDVEEARSILVDASRLAMIGGAPTGLAHLPWLFALEVSTPPPAARTRSRS